MKLFRRDCGHHTTITLAGEIDLDTAPALRVMVEDCLREGIRTVDIDLTVLDFCDVSGLNAFLAAPERTASQGSSLHLRHPRPPMARLLDLSDTGFLLHTPHPAATSLPASHAMPAVRPGRLAS